MTAIDMAELVDQQLVREIPQSVYRESRTKIDSRRATWKF